MKKLTLLFAVILCINFAATKVSAQTAPVLSGIDDNSDYYKFAALARSANLGPTLDALGSYTVLAVPNIIFRNMSPGKLDSLEKNPATVIKAHIIKGKYNKAAIIKLLTVGKGKATLTNILGQTLKLTLTKDSKLTITDSKGNTAYFNTFDLPDPHGVIHGVDNVFVIGK